MVPLNGVQKNMIKSNNKLHYSRMLLMDMMVYSQTTFTICIMLSSVRDQLGKSEQILNIRVSALFKKFIILTLFF